MVVSVSHRVRNKIDHIWERLILSRTGIRDDWHLSNDVLRQFQIEHVTQFEFGNLDSVPINLSHTPPILIHPMPLDELHSFPVEETYMGDVRPFLDFDASKAGQFGWQADSCARRICDNVQDWATCASLRPILFSAPDSFVWYPQKRGLDSITDPNAFLLGGDLIGRDFRVTEVLETDGYPLVTSLAYHSHDGVEDSILHGELALLVQAMRNRAHQPRVESEEQLEELEYLDEEERTKQCELEFPKEEGFPVLLLSFVGRQHGRFFYASFNGRQMVIRQSKLYSFETKANAPLDLFARVFLSCPV